MRGLRLGLGFAAAGLIALSALAHSILGWRALSAELAKVGAPADLVRSLSFGWHFGGVAMIAFASILFMTFGRVARGVPASRGAVLAIAAAYTLFGLWALISTTDPFFLVFAVPGILLLAASFLWPQVP